MSIPTTPGFVEDVIIDADSADLIGFALAIDCRLANEIAVAYERAGVKALVQDVEGARVSARAELNRRLPRTR